MRTHIDTHTPTEYTDSQRVRKLRATDTTTTHSMPAAKAETGLHTASHDCPCKPFAWRDTPKGGVVCYWHQALSDRKPGKRDKFWFVMCRVRRGKEVAQ